MANVKISDLTAYTNPAGTDVVPIVDLVNDQTKKVALADIFQNFPDGTAAAPSIAFDGDSNTGIYRPGADQLALATNGSERMRIDSTGIVKATSRYDVTGNFGASSNPGNGNAQFTSYTAFGATILGQGSSYDISFLNKAGNFAGYVATGATTITTSSDERLKENFQPIENALEIVATMRHETGNYKSDPDRQVAFLVAQDVDQHWPYAVDKSNPDSWGVNYNWIIPLHGAAIAELKSIIETQQQLIASLETRLSALEAS